MIHLRKILLSVVAIICCSISTRAQEQQTYVKVSYPSFKESIQDSAKKSRKKKTRPYDKKVLTEVELNDTATVLTFEYTCLRSASDYTISNNSFLVTTKDGEYAYYDLLGAEGITTFPELTVITKGNSVKFKLIFEPLPAGTIRFNLFEMSGWNLADIDLSSSNSPDNQQIGTFDIEEYFVHPTFLGGDINNVSKWVNSRLKYPEFCRIANIQERILLKLTIGKDGNVHPEIIEGKNQLLIDEALRVTGMLPPMTPFTIYGRECVITYTFPIVFELRTPKKH